MKALFKILGLGAGIVLSCMGCGSGVTVVALVSPSISGVSPQVVTAGTPSVTLTVKGANFTSESAVTFNGTTIPTSVVSSDTLAAQVGGSALSQPTVAQLQVQNADGVKSNAVPLTVTGDDDPPDHPSALTITTSALPNGQVGAVYAATLAASGGTPGYTWSISAGSLPAGLALSTGGVISGTATASGTFNLTVKVTDSGSPVQTQTASFSITESPATTVSPLTITSTTLSGAQVGVSYSTTLAASGGTPAYSWSISSGSLPAGLALSSAGVISGTPTSSGTANFTVQVADSGSPAQTQTASLSIAVTTTKLAITTTSLPAGEDGTGYSAALAASGGTPGYVWSLSSGALPAGLALSSAGVISGTPTGTGSSSFTVTVTDSGSPAQTASLTASINVTAAPPTEPGTTWFVRPDGGTRYSADVTHGQCDGQADISYAEAVQANGGVIAPNLHCAFNDVRYMWMDGSYGNFGWVMAGGDTLVIRGCTALPAQQNPSNPDCRIGYDTATHTGTFCYGTSGCSMPPPPSGTSGAPTRILGACAYGTYTCNPVNGYPYTSNNLTQLYGGFGLLAVVSLEGSSYVDVEGLEITTHNGTCTRVGSPAYPSTCSSSSPFSDYATEGIQFSSTSTNDLLQDVYIHGFSGEGIYGATGAGIVLTRVGVDFNSFMGWQMDDGTGFSSDATLTQSYVQMVGNGCMEEYPIVDTAFPALACWDDSTAGFGDSWSAGNSTMNTFTCDHCLVAYNMKDGLLGPHTKVSNMSLTNSIWIGNQGQAWKMTQPKNSTGLFQNNLLVTNCYRLKAAESLSQPIPGSSSSLSSHIYSGDPCRASNTAIAYNADAGSTVNFVNNTLVTYQATIFEIGCTTAGNCGSLNYNFTNNLILGYTNNYRTVSGFSHGVAPGLYYNNDSQYGYRDINFVGLHNLEYGVRNGDPCGSNGNVCNDPDLLNEPAQGTVAPGESALDVFTANLANSSFNLTSGSTFAIGHGTSSVYTPTSDANGNPQTSPMTIGALVQQ